MYTVQSDSERTESVFRGDFYMTGDSARRDDDGYFWFAARVDDVINSAGYVTDHCVAATPQRETVKFDPCSIETPELIEKKDCLRRLITKPCIKFGANPSTRASKKFIHSFFLYLYQENSSNSGEIKNIQ